MTWTATDAAGNQAIDTQTVTIEPITEVGTVRGTVFQDFDYDGIREEVGRALLITVIDNDGNIVTGGTSSSTGVYSFPNVPVGEYRVRIALPANWVATLPDVGNDDSIDSDLSDGDRTAPFTLGAGETVTLDLGIVADLAVFGYVFDDADADGVRDSVITEPGVGGVIVELLDTGGSTLMSTSTDGNGDYRLAFSTDGLVPGTYRIRMTPPDGWEFTATTLFEVGLDGMTDPFDLGSGGAQIRASITENVAPPDTTPPTIVAPPDVVVTDGDPILIGTPTVNDDTDPTPVVTNDAPAQFPLGTTTVTWTATDAAGNSASDTQDVTVEPVRGLVVEMTSPPITTEGGGAATFTVRPTSRPDGVVTVPISSSDQTEGRPDFVLLTFNWHNWETPVTVTVTGQDDALDDGDIEYTIVFGELFGGGFAGIDPDDLTLTNLDDDDPLPPAIRVTPTAGLLTSETGATATFAVSLDALPTGTVTIPVSSSDPSEGTASMTSLTFDTTNWQVAQTVTVTGVDDSDLDGAQPYTIVLGAATGGGYDGIDPTDVSVINVDDEAAATGTISGKSWFDNDYSDTYSFGDDPAVGVTVYLEDAVGNVLRSTTTGSDGTYVFGPLAAGEYVVRFDPPSGGLSWPVGEFGGPPDVDSDIYYGTNSTDVLSVGAGQQLVNIDAGWSPQILG
ncbi:MAG: SdrD B-like domain-containing protein [Ilumatobacteraceae bacterium]